MIENFDPKTYSIEIKNWPPITFINDENTPTGTHKDRLAKKIVDVYKKHHLNKKPSLISTGSAGLAIQYELLKQNLPNLKVLVEKSMPDDIKLNLKNTNCEVFETIYGKTNFTSNEILNLTQNPQGIDLTSIIAKTTNHYTDLVDFILKHPANLYLVPFATGTLLKGFPKDKSLGITSQNPDSKMNKICTKAFLEHSKAFPNQLHTVSEEFVDQAIEIATDQNINAEPSALAGLAWLLQVGLNHPLVKNKKIAIVGTGNTKSVADIPLFNS